MNERNFTIIINYNRWNQFPSEVYVLRKRVNRRRSETQVLKGYTKGIGKGGPLELGVGVHLHPFTNYSSNL